MLPFCTFCRAYKGITSPPAEWQVEAREATEEGSHRGHARVAPKPRRWATAGGTAESRTTSGRAAASEDGEGTCRTRATGQQIQDVMIFGYFLGITVVEVKEWDVEWF